MFNTYVIQNTETNTLPDRLLTEVYKDKRAADRRRFEQLNILLGNPTVQQVKRMLYKGGNNFICDGEFVQRADVEWFLDYKEKCCL